MSVCLIKIIFNKYRISNKVFLIPINHLIHTAASQRPEDCTAPQTTRGCTCVGFDMCALILCCCFEMFYKDQDVPRWGGF